MKILSLDEQDRFPLIGLNAAIKPFKAVQADEKQLFERLDFEAMGYMTAGCAPKPKEEPLAKLSKIVLYRAGDDIWAFDEAHWIHGKNAFLRCSVWKEFARVRTNFDHCPDRWVKPPVLSRPLIRIEL